MSTARRSLAEDEVDGYNKTWVFYLLLLLSLATWILPLSLITLSSGDVSQSTRSGDSPGFVASCWCPMHFSWSSVNFVHTSCASAFNKAIRDAVHGPDNKTKLTASLFNYVNNISDMISFDPNVEETEKRKQGKNKIISYEHKHFIFVRTPLILFALALCLKLPHLAWASLSSFTELGLGHLLESARAAQLLDDGVRSRFKEELKKVIGKIKQSSFFNSILYLLLKVLTLLVTLAGLFIVSYKLLPQTESLRGDLDQRASSMAIARKYLGSSLFCQWETVGQNLDKFTVQCTFTPGSSSPTESSTDKELALIWLYESMFTILVFLFAVLVTVNVISLLAWAVRLAPGSLCKKVPRNSGYSVDSYLLQYMANLDAGPLVASCLEQCLSEETPRERQTGEELNKLCD